MSLISGLRAARDHQTIVHIPERRIQTLAAHECFMVALFTELSVVQHIDDVGMAHRRQAMRNDDDRTLGGQAGNRPLNGRFGLTIHR